MTIDELLTELKKLNIILTGRELANIWGMSEENVSRIKNGKKPIKAKYLEIIENKFNISLIKSLTNNETSFAAAAKLPDVVEIPYWDGLPEELKHPEYTHVLAQRISIEQGWGLETENLRIVPMVGDKMTNYWYTIRANDILIIDTSYQHIAGNGVYFATSRNNTRYWIREMQVLFNDDVELKGFSPSGNTTKILTRAQLQEVDFRIIGKVVKNVSFRL